MTITADQLLEHANWAKALARQLVGDAADDLVQDAWVAAIDAPPAKAVRPWLGGVLRNLARLRYRGESRRKAREAKLEALEVPATAVVVERAEAQRTLVNAVLALPEPYRATVLLRYFEDRSAADIARAQGIPAGTVRSRLHDGLRMLRGRLDDEFEGDTRAWCAALLPLARADVTTGISAAAFTGLLLMKLTKLTAALAAITALLFWAGVPLPFFGEAAADRPPETVSFRPLPAPAAPVATATPAPRERVAVATAAPDPERALRIRARLVDAAAAPIPGARFDAKCIWTGAGSAISDAGGAVEIALPVTTAQWESIRRNAATLDVECRASHPRFANETRAGLLATDRTLDFGDIVMQAGGAIAGRVLDPAGRPVEGAEVSVAAGEKLERRGDLFTSQPGTTGGAKTRTDRDGGFRLGGVRAGTVRVTAKVDEFTSGTSGPVEVRAGQESYDLVLIVLDTIPAEDRLRGLVLDPAGEPVPYARISAVFSTMFRSGSSGATSDANGRFEEKVHARTAHRVLVADPRNAWHVAFDPSREPGTFRTFRLLEPTEMTLVVRDQAGRPIDAEAMVFHRKPNHNFHAHVALPIPGEGTVPMPAIPFELRITAEGHHARELGPFDPEQLGTGARIECALDTAPMLHGTVTSGGEPAAGAKVTLHRLARDQSTVDDFPVWIDPSTVGSAETDAAGRFRFTMEQQFEFVVHVELDGFAIAESGPHPASRLAEELTVELDEGGILEGRVVARPGQSPAGTIVGISRGDGHARTQRVGADGAFRFERLTPGRWLVRENDQELSSHGSSSSSSMGSPYRETPWVCEVFAGKATVHDLVLDAATACRLDGVMRLGDDNPTAWTVRLVAEADRAIPLVTLGADGRFVLTTDRAGRYRLLFASEEAGQRIEAFVELREGPNRWSFEQPTAKLTITDAPELDPDAFPTAVRWREGDVMFLAPIAGKDGVCELVVPKGTVDVVRATAETFDDPERWPVLRQLDAK